MFTLKVFLKVPKIWNLCKKKVLSLHDKYSQRMICIIDFGHHSLCLSDEQQWLIKGPHNICYLSEPHEPQCILSLLPVLEMEYNEFLNVLNSYNLDENVVNRFPLIPLLKYPFDNQREFWSELAIDWIEKSNKANDMREWALSIPRNWMPQKLMHKFRKVFQLPKGWDKI